ncbi:unnamed protein product [Fraxinus pennsylvanica]|uniref:Nodulin-like domain-containing protein n=1 Tax=Fraxinus pennsylvanica TaxID=56036 RepID=A0AAD1Z8X2_9LAMI|nr:unnamed protein product [Fraxinus pennsylvanica]
MILVASIWIQAFTGTNFDFSSYSTGLKSVMGISQVQLNYLSVASDVGKAFGWCSGICLLYFPSWLVMFIAAFTGLIGYGLQWLVIQKIIYLPYFLVFLLCLLAGCSICWFNTEWASRTIHSSFNLMNNDDLDVHRELMEMETPQTDDVLYSGPYNSKEKEGSGNNVLFKDNLKPREATDSNVRHVPVLAIMSENYPKLLR